MVKDRRVVYESYFGYAGIARRRPVDRDTAFYIASVTKPFFALNALLLEHRGAVDTRTSLQAMFPCAAFAGIDADAITARNLLEHTSGLGNAPLIWATALSGMHDAASRKRLVAHLRPNADAATGTFKYTNVG